MTDSAAAAPTIDQDPPIPPAPLSSADVDGLAVTRRRPNTADRSTPTVVLVHGAVDRSASFGRTMRRLGDLDVVAYDRRGYAGSLESGVAPTIAAHADDLAAVIEWSGATDAVVVGHSLGGTIAAALAARTDTALRAIAVYESPFPALDDSFDRVGGGAVELGRTQGPAVAAEHFYRMMVGDETWSRLRDGDRDRRRAEGPALLAELEDLRLPEHAVAIDAIRVPVTIGVGALSSAWLRSGSELLASELESADVAHEFVDIDGVGHGVHLSHPGEFARFVRRASTPTGGLAG